MKRRTVMGAAGLAALGVAGMPAWAQPKIGGDVRFFCGFPPGGTADLLCRLLAEARGSALGAGAHRRELAAERDELLRVLRARAVGRLKQWLTVTIAIK